MGLLSDIQAALLDEKVSLAPIMLKMRVLAARLGSVELGDWVKYEMEGYPGGVELPPYRRVPISYFGTFFGGFGSSITDAPIPHAAIYTFVDKDAVLMRVGESISGVEQLVVAASKHGVISTTHPDYPLQLQGKIYPDYACASITGRISAASFVDILTNVRSKLLDLILKIETELPEAKDVELASAPILQPKKQAEINHIVNNVVYGNVSNVTNTGDSSTFNVTISQGNVGDVAEALSGAGIDGADAKEFADILASETPESQEQPLGPKAQNWVSANVGKAMNGAWKIGLPVASSLLIASAKHFYGLN
jgi:hypothetical protein